MKTVGLVYEKLRCSINDYSFSNAFLKIICIIENDYLVLIF